MSESCRAQITSLFELTKPRIRIEYFLVTHLLVRSHGLEWHVIIDHPARAPHNFPFPLVPLRFPDPLVTKARPAPAAQEGPKTTHVDSHTYNDPYSKPHRLIHLQNNRGGGCSLWQITTRHIPCL